MRPWSAALGCVCLLAVWVGTAVAQELPALGTAPSGLPGLMRVGSPVSAPHLSLGASAGYGVVGTVEPAGGKHPRAAGAIAAAYAPNDNLALALHLSGRIDFHAGEEGQSYSGAVGDPRLRVRAGRALSDALSIGGELGLWVPGRQAPSFDFGATSLDVAGLLAFRAPGSRWSLLGMGGFRLDNSAHAAPDLSRLRAGDRVSLGLSDFNALLLGLGGAYRATRELEAFAELSGDVLVGRGAPSFSGSPLRASLGGRYFVSAPWQVELGATLGLSKRPAIGAEDPLVPIEPRFYIGAALRYRWSLAEDAGAAHVATPSRAPATAQLRGRLLDPAGHAVPEANVILRAADGSERAQISDANGRYRFDDVRVGPAQLEIRAVGFAPVQLDVEVGASTPPQSTALAPATGSGGVVRGLVRTFRSEPLVAQIRVRARGQVVRKAQSDAAGAFELELPAGDYEIVISAPGYAAQRRNVAVGEGRVAILNVDMREP